MLATNDDTLSEGMVRRQAIFVKIPNSLVDSSTAIRYYKMGGCIRTERGSLILPTQLTERTSDGVTLYLPLSA